MNNDLISREDLKKALSDPLYCSTIKDYGEVLKYTFVMDIIDNAPTAELTETEVQEVLNKRCMTAVANDFLIALQLKTLHGRWDEIREPFGWDDILSARCSVCGESYPYPEDTGFNDIVEMFKYCPNCGAKMEAGNRWKEEDDEE